MEISRFLERKFIPDVLEFVCKLNSIKFLPECFRNVLLFERGVIDISENKKNLSLNLSPAIREALNPTFPVENEGRGLAVCNCNKFFPEMSNQLLSV